MSPEVEVRVLTTGPPGKSPQCFKRYKRVGTENSFSHHHHTPSFCMFLILLPIHNQIHELFECSFRGTLYTSKKVYIYSSFSHNWGNSIHIILTFVFLNLATYLGDISIISI